jgi:hypothetical protein
MVAAQEFHVRDKQVKLEFKSVITRPVRCFGGL